MAALFFSEMRYDPRDPENPDNDRFVLSKGHAAPILYAAWAEAGICTREDVMSLRKLSSDLEGHPTPRLPWVDVATGSLGQGLCAGVGIALNARRIRSDYRTYVLLGDGETAEGSVWEAAEMGAFHDVDSLCGIVDVNALGQSRPTALQHDMDAYAARWRAFGWHADRRGRSRRGGHPRRLRGGAPHPGPADDDPGAHHQGQGHLRSSKARAAGTASRSRPARKSRRRSPS